MCNSKFVASNFVKTKKELQQSVSQPTYAGSSGIVGNVTNCLWMQNNTWPSKCGPSLWSEAKHMQMTSLYFYQYNLKRPH